MLTWLCHTGSQRDSSWAGILLGRNGAQLQPHSSLCPMQAVMCSPYLWWMVTARKDALLFPSQWGAAIWILFHVMSVHNTFLSTSLPCDHTRMLCKTLTAGQLCALPWRHETAKGSFYSHLFFCTIVLWKTSRNHCFLFFLCVQQHQCDHCTWGWWSSGPALLISLLFALLPTAANTAHSAHYLCRDWTCKYRDLERKTIFQGCFKKVFIYPFHSEASLSLGREKE